MMEMLLFLTYLNGPFKAEEVLGIVKSESMNLFQAGLSPLGPRKNFPYDQDSRRSFNSQTDLLPTDLNDLNFYVVSEKHGLIYLSSQD